MTLLDAVQSLGIVELAAVSAIHIRATGSRHTAVFMMALLLPFADTALPEEFHTGRLRFWPDQKRMLDSPLSIEDQIVELHRSRLLGNLSSIQLQPLDRAAPALWLIKTHAGSPGERDQWLRSVIAMEGRIPSK